MEKIASRSEIRREGIRNVIKMTAEPAGLRKTPLPVWIAPEKVEIHRDGPRLMVSKIAASASSEPLATMILSRWLENFLELTMVVPTIKRTKRSI